MTEQMTDVGRGPWSRWLVAVVVLGLAGIGVAVWSYWGGDETTRRADPETERDIGEAAFRYLFDNHGSSDGESAPAYYLKWNGEDPPDAFLDRFRDHDPPVRKVSRRRNEHGVKFVVSVVEVDGRRAAVFGKYHAGPLGAAGYNLTLEFRNGEWTVVDSEMLWIS